MGIVKWTAVAVTLLMGLANLGQVVQDLSVGWKLLGVVLASAAVGACIGVIAKTSWGLAAIIAVGAANLCAALLGAVNSMEGWPVGVVLATLAILLGVVSLPRSRAEVIA